MGEEAADGEDSANDAGFFISKSRWSELRVDGIAADVNFTQYLEVVSDQAEPAPIWGDSALLQRLFWATAMPGLGALFFASVYMVHFE